MHIHQNEVPRLVEIITRILKAKDIVNFAFADAGSKYYKEDSIWGEICIEYLGYFDNTMSSNIYMKFTRDLSLRTLVERTVVGGVCSKGVLISPIIQDTSHSGIEINRINNLSDTNKQRLVPRISPKNGVEPFVHSFGNGNTTQDTSFVPSSSFITANAQCGLNSQPPFKASNNENVQSNFMFMNNPNQRKQTGQVGIPLHLRTRILQVYSTYYVK